MNRNKRFVKNIMNLRRFETSPNMIERNDAAALIEEQIATEIIQGVVEGSAVLRMGKKLRNMTAKEYVMPVLDMLPTAYFVNGDNGTKKLTKAAWDKKRIYAEEIAVIIPIAEAVLDDSSYDIWGELKPRIIEAFGAVIDGAIIFGDNKPTSWRDGIVVGATTAGNVKSLGSDLYADIMGEGGVIDLVEQDGFFVTGHMAAINMRAKLRGLRDTVGQPLFKTEPNGGMQGVAPYVLDGAPMDFPRNGAFDATDALMISGDFSQLVYSIRQDITYKLLTEATITDPSTGQVLYNLAQQDMVALRVVMRLGWEIPNPINRLNADKATRFPFAVLTPASEPEGQDLDGDDDPEESPEGAPEGSNV